MFFFKFYSRILKDGNMGNVCENFTGNVCDNIYIVTSVCLLSYYFIICILPEVLALLLQEMIELKLIK